MLPVNYLAVVLAALACFVVGFMMHGPVAGKKWMKLANIHPTGKEKFSDMVPQMLWNLLANLVTAYGLSAVYLFAITSPVMGGTGAINGMVCAFWCWLGFYVTATSMDVIWMKGNKKLWYFELATAFLSYMAMGAIIGAMN